MRATHLLALAALTAVVASSPAQVTRKGKGYLFRVAYRKGQTLKYVTTSTVQGLGQGGKGLTFSLPLTQQVLSVNKGIATIKATAKPPQQGPAAGQGRTVIVKLDRQNRPVGGDRLQSVGAAFPDGPIAVGGTWRANAPIPLGGGTGGRVQVVFKLQGFKSVAGKRAAVLGATLTGFAQGGGTMLINAADGTLQNANLKLTIQAGQQGRFPVSIVVKRTA